MMLVLAIIIGAVFLYAVIGMIYATLRKPQEQASIGTSTLITSEHPCPKCSSASISLGEKGPSIGKMLAGGIVAGPIGIVLGSFIGAKKKMVYCKHCGHKWRYWEYKQYS